MKDYTGPDIGDAFGAALDAYWRGNTEAQLLIERDDGFIESNQPSLYFGAPDDLDEWDGWALERATGRVLDVGCGPGRHMAALQARGFDVVGVDPSALLVAICHERGFVAVEGALPDLPTDLGVFDTLLLLGNNLGLQGSREEAQGVLAGPSRRCEPSCATPGHYGGPLSGRLRRRAPPVPPGQHRRRAATRTSNAPSEVSKPGRPVVSLPADFAPRPRGTPRRPTLADRRAPRQ